tara:strand:- start:5258 stop:6133 length:876 start_codon:yes stop_codon:yes gene_type:complete
MDNEYRLIKTCEHAFDVVTQALNDVVEAYRHTLGQAWALHSPRPDTDWLADALLDIWYEGDQDGRMTRSYIGLIAADDALLQVVANANAAKDDFFNAMAAIKETHPQRISHLKYELAHRKSRFGYVNEHLRRTGLARLHLKQAWRHIPSIEQPAVSIRMAWYTSGKSIRRLTVQEAEKKLSMLDTEAPHIRLQLQKLAGIPSSEPLAVVQDLTPQMRANVFFQEPLEDGRLRRAMNLPLPLFVPSANGLLPNHNQPLPYPKKQRVRSVRRDLKLEDTPFLPSIRVHRYRSE